jgi:hypothetical protein
LIFRTKAEAAGDFARDVILLKSELHAAGIVGAASEAGIARLGLQFFDGH